MDYEVANQIMICLKYKVLYTHTEPFSINSTYSTIIN